MDEVDGTFTENALFVRLFVPTLQRRHDLAKCQASVADDMRNVTRLKRSAVHPLSNHLTQIQSRTTTTSSGYTNPHHQHNGPIIVIR